MRNARAHPWIGAPRFDTLDSTSGYTLHFFDGEICSRRNPASRADLLRRRLYLSAYPKRWTAYFRQASGGDGIYSLRLLHCAHIMRTKAEDRSAPVSVSAASCVRTFSTAAVDLQTYLKV
jgi:hypothetical protein